jgi:hypothetical protein
MKRPATVESGSIVNRGIHDATIHAFRFVENEQLDLCLRSPDGNDRWLCLVDVPRFGFQDVVNGSIVSDVYCWGLSDCPEILDETVAWQVLLGYGSCKGHDVVPEAARLAAKYATHSLVFVTTSYGGLIAAICREVLMEHHPTDPLL